MYLGVDIGGSKTLLSVLDDHGVIKEHQKFPTPRDYSQFQQEFSLALASLQHKDFRAGAIGAPGKLDREKGIGHTFGNLPWHEVPIQNDIEQLTHCPMAFDNDANLAGLSEAMLLPEYHKVLYITISTGIGTGIIFNQQISPAFADSEGGQMLLEYRGKLRTWESFASGHAIAERYGKFARDITDDTTWKAITRLFAVGFIELVAVVQPEVIVIGGSIGTYFDRYEQFLHDALQKYQNPLVIMPPIRKASRPEEAVIYGCYDLAKQIYGTTR